MRYIIDCKNSVTDLTDNLSSVLSDDEVSDYFKYIDIESTDKARALFYEQQLVTSVIITEDMDLHRFSDSGVGRTYYIKSDNVTLFPMQTCVNDRHLFVDADKDCKGVCLDLTQHVMDIKHLHVPYGKIKFPEGTEFNIGSLSCLHDTNFSVEGRITHVDNLSFSDASPAFAEYIISKIDTADQLSMYSSVTVKNRKEKLCIAENIKIFKFLEFRILCDSEITVDLMGIDRRNCKISLRSVNRKEHKVIVLFKNAKGIPIVENGGKIDFMVHTL